MFDKTPWIFIQQKRSISKDKFDDANNGVVPIQISGLKKWMHTIKYSLGKL